MLRFTRDGNGTWTFGQKRIVVEDGSRWAVNPRSFKRGYICFGDGNKLLGERLVSVTQEMPNLAELPDKGSPWQAAMGRQPEMPRRHRCRRRGDLQADDRRRHPGRRRADRGVRDRLNGGQHDGKVSPIVLLEKDLYPQRQFGRVWTPPD